jgi:hypothetical protein
VTDVEKMPKYDTLGNNGTISAQFLDVNLKKVASTPLAKTVNQILKKDNFIIGSNFDDYINAGAGNDTIASVAGMDILTGGSGKDTFTLIYKAGFAKVTDLSVKKDTIVTEDDSRNLSWSKDSNYSYLYDRNNNLIAYFDGKPNLGKAKFFRFDQMTKHNQSTSLEKLSKMGSSYKRNSKSFFEVLQAGKPPRNADFVSGDSSVHELDEIMLGGTSDSAII